VRSSLLARIAAIALSVMALTMLLAAVLTQQLIRVEYRQELDRLLRQEMTEVQLGLPAELEAATGPDGVADAAELELAVRRYLALNPGSDRHLTIIQVGSNVFSTRDGPPDLQQPQRENGLPPGIGGTLTTVGSSGGSLRMLTASLESNGSPIGTLTVVGPLAPGRAQATQAFGRIGLASAAGLLVGGVLLVFALKRALQPVHDLAAAARSADLGDLDVRVPEPDTRDEVATTAREFNRMLERIGDDEQRRTQLLSAISHELRTPLAVARGHLELLEMLGLDSRQTVVETAGVAREELDRLGRIVDDLTAINRGDRAAETAREPVFAPDVLEALQLRTTGLDLNGVTIEPAPPVVLIGDEDRMTQALLNLVMNAHTHTPPDTAITVDAVVEGDHLAFRVIDQGPGIEPALLPTVFDPFVTTKTKGAGRTSGLGLTVVKAVTEAQGGAVELSSGPHGTAVQLSFPLDRED
jgi:two-component system, OmpR family, sensor kinase